MHVLLCELCGALFHPEDLEKYKKRSDPFQPKCLFCQTELVPYE